MMTVVVHSKCIESHDRCALPPLRGARSDTDDILQIPLGDGFDRPWIWRISLHLHSIVYYMVALFTMFCVLLLGLSVPSFA